MNELHARLVRFFGEEADLLVTVFALVKVSSFVDVLGTIFKQAVNEPSEFIGHSLNRFRRP